MPYHLFMAEANERIVKEREEAQQLEADRPLLREALEALAGMALPGVYELSAREIAEAYNENKAIVAQVSTEQVQAELDQMVEDGCLLPPEDGLYELTVEGEVRLRNLRAYGSRLAPPPAPSREDEIRFLRSALNRAVERYRADGDATEYRDRLTAIIREAGKREAEDLAQAAEQQMEQLGQP